MSVHYRDTAAGARLVGGAVRGPPARVGTAAAGARGSSGCRQGEQGRLHSAVPREPRRRAATHSSPQQHQERLRKGEPRKKNEYETYKKKNISMC